MVTIYQDYDDEPEDTFRPLPDWLASTFYATEMDGFTGDLTFYAPLLSSCKSLLEMGCGTGRLTDHFADSNRLTVGIDISTPMLQIAKEKSNAHAHYLCMDMMCPAFTSSFDNIIIPYNTLNLLETERRIAKCLQGCKSCLHPEGQLLAQLYIPTDNFTNEKKKTFQFQMFDRPGGGKIIKEIIKEYVHESQSIMIEERYRVRPLQNDAPNEDYNCQYTIAGFSFDRWVSIFEKSGLKATHLYGTAEGLPFRGSSSSSLFAIFSRQ